MSDSKKPGIKRKRVESNADEQQQEIQSSGSSSPSSASSEQSESPKPTSTSTSSPSKRPRTSDENESEKTSVVRDKVKKITMEDKPLKSIGFASAAQKASSFAAYTTSGFAKYTANPLATSSEDKKTEDSPKKPASFEDMLKADSGSLSLDKSPLASPTSCVVSTGEPIKTYEEDEDSLFTAKGKLFELQENNWKERGGGQFKINQKLDDPCRCRLVMRTDQTFRLILNIPLTEHVRCGVERRFVRFTCIDPGTSRPATFVLRFATEAMAADVERNIKEHVPKQEEEEGEKAEEKKDSDHGSEKDDVETKEDSDHESNDGSEQESEEEQTSEEEQESEEEEQEEGSENESEEQGSEGSEEEQKEKSDK